jgi:hypothetical protein
MSELRTWLDDHNRYGDDEEISKFKKFKDSLEKALTENVVDPMSKAGYPNAGAAIATVPMVAADLVIPETTAETMPGMAGVGKLKRRATRAFKDIKKSGDLVKRKLSKIDDELYKEKELNREFYEDNNEDYHNIITDLIYDSKKPEFHDVYGDMEDSIDHSRKKLMNDLNKKMSRDIIGIKDRLVPKIPEKKSDKPVTSDFENVRKLFDGWGY